jgi:hypothetical protein
MNTLLSADVEDLFDVVCSLGRTEQRVLLYIARRMSKGQAVYGELNLISDRRDWNKERAEELADAVIYQAIADVAKSNDP